MDKESSPPPPHPAGAARIGFFAAFSSPAVECAFRRHHFRHDRWLNGFLITAAMLRVALFLLADYQHFGTGPAFRLLLAARLLFLLASAGALVALRRAGSPAAADRIFFGWCLLLAAFTASSLSARPPSNTALLFMSFGVVLVAYCVTPLPLPHQAVVALSYSALVLYVSRRADGETLSMVGAAYALSNLFGAAVSWQLNRRRREAFLGTVREAELRAGLERALAEIRTLRGLLCICAWCKRIRVEAEAWQGVEQYVQSRTHASFTHAMCPDCLQSQVGELARSARPGA